MKMDKGPWEVGQAEKNSRVIWLESEDFEHDVRLYINGDFADSEQKLEYARQLRDKLNGS